MNTQLNMILCSVLNSPLLTMLRKISMEFFNVSNMKSSIYNKKIKAPHYKFSCLSIHLSSWLLYRLKREHLGPHDWLSIPVPGGHDWMVVPGLEPETTYQFSVLAQNKLGTGPFSEVVTVNTLGEYTAYFVTGTKISKNKMSLAWMQLL